MLINTHYKTTKTKNKKKVVCLIKQNKLYKQLKQPELFVYDQIIIKTTWVTQTTLINKGKIKNIFLMFDVLFILGCFFQARDCMS